LKLVAFSVLLGMVGTAGAARPHALDREVGRRMSPGWDTCIDSSGGIIGVMIDCNTREMERQDAKLNETYRTVMARLPHARRASLRAAERAWVRRRDPSCEAHVLKREGPYTTQFALDLSHCLLRATIVRTILLERYAAGRTTLAELGRDLTR
jgi:uncharacterized protein YecT (DUF1311 family)